jgi:hypothetical protein
MLVLAAVASVAFVFGFLAVAGVGFSLRELLQNAPPIIKMADMLLAGLFMLVLAVGFIRVATEKEAKESPFLRVMILIAVLLGALCFAYEASITWSAVRAAHTTNFRVIAPSLAEATVQLSLGLIVGAFGSILNAMGGSKRRAAAA